MLVMAPPRSAKTRPRIEASGPTAPTDSGCAMNVPRPCRTMSQPSPASSSLARTASAPEQISPCRPSRSNFSQQSLKSRVNGRDHMFVLTSITQANAGRRTVPVPAEDALPYAIIGLVDLDLINDNYAVGGRSALPVGYMASASIFEQLPCASPSVRAMVLALVTGVDAIVAQPLAAAAKTLHGAPLPAHGGNSG